MPRGWEKIPYGELKPEKVKAYYGGSFPDCNGKKYKYPRPTAEKTWMRLITDALNYQRKIAYYKKNKMYDKVKKERNYRYEYVLYHCRPEQKKRRSIRNQHRAKMQEKTGQSLKGKHVHHTDPVSMSFGKAKVMTKAEHRKFHSDDVKKLQKKEAELKAKKTVKKTVSKKS